MKVICKYPIRGSKISVPTGARVLHCGLQGNDICVWAAVNPAAAHVERRCYVFATGEAFADRLEAYVGTIQMSNGLVFHVFVTPE